MTNEEIFRAACDVVWSQGDVERIDEFYGESFQANYPMTNWGTGLEGIRNLVQELKEGIPDYCERIDELIDAGDRIIVRLTITGTHTGPLSGVPATGKSFEFRDVTVGRIENGKIVEQWGLSDYLTLYIQLGLIELPAVNR
jgi:steroid delta-isomerase-like uncharacterized protein